MPQSKAPKGRPNIVRPFAGKPGDMAERLDSRTGKPLAPANWDRVSDGLTWDPDCPKCQSKIL